MTDKELVNILKNIINITTMHLFFDIQLLSSKALSPGDWFIIKPTKKKLGKDYDKYLGIRFIYKRWVEDIIGGYPDTEQILVKEPWTKEDLLAMDKYINQIKDMCKIEKKLVYREGDKRVIYELFIKKDDILPLFGLQKLQKSI